jgi:aminopeptidase N
MQSIAPGYLQKEWRENGRRYFHYKTEAPILSFWSYLSARYEVRRGQWKDVPIEVYYHPSHPYNVDRMIDGVKKSLTYFTEHFSPCQHRQVRILEFPRYERFAQSFPNTIPFSESIGFIASLEDPEDIDYVFYVTAHEIAHQWWAHQVIGGDVQGATVYTTAMELVERLRAAAPEERRSLIHDLFETITLFDIRASEAKATPLPGGKYQVRWVVEVKKFRADERGAEQEIPVNDLMEVAVFGKDKAPLWIEKRRVTEPRTTIEATVDALPEKAGVDPYNKLVDRDPDDNVTATSLDTGAQASR